MLTHLDLFSGIGGFALACEWAGIETIGFVEIDKYCQKVLKKHWPNVPIVEDIRDVEEIKEVVEGAKESLRSIPKSCNGKRIPREMGRITQEEKELRAITSNLCSDDSRQPRGTGQPAILITAGFPCQPFSVAGKQLSQGDDRYLWPQTIAVIEAIKPTWVLLENVAGIINLALDTVLSDLEGAGYSWETLIIPACAVNAPHRRDRIWIVANSRCREQRQCGNPNKVLDGRNSKERPTSEISRPSSIFPDSKSGQSREQTEPEGREDTSRGSEEDVADSRLLRQTKRQQPATGTSQCDWWSVEPELGRVAHGIPRRVDRLKCLGNAIVPQVAYEIIKVIRQVELI